MSNELRMTGFELYWAIRRDYEQALLDQIEAALIDQLYQQCCSLHILMFGSLGMGPSIVIRLRS